MNKVIFFASAALASLALYACGGGDGSQNTTSPSDNISQENNDLNESGGVEIEVIAGGTASTPTLVDPLAAHLIRESSGENYFKIRSQAGERVFIYTDLEFPLTDIEKARCGGQIPGIIKNPNDYSTMISVYNDSFEKIGGTCFEDYNLISAEDSDYIFHFDPSYGNSGYGFFATTAGGSAISRPSGLIGSPSNPRELQLDARNYLANISFFNYFKIKLNSGDKLIISTTLNTPFSGVEQARCGSINPIEPEDQFGHNANIRTYSSEYQQIIGACGEDLTFDVSVTGDYIFNFTYGGGRDDGYFVASKI